jgi:hypothetical protein
MQNDDRSGLPPTRIASCGRRRSPRSAGAPAQPTISPSRVEFSFRRSGARMRSRERSYQPDSVPICATVERRLASRGRIRDKRHGKFRSEPAKDAVPR